MAYRVTRAESVGLQPPNVEELREAFGTFREQLAKTEAQFDDFLAAGGGSYSPSEGLAAAGGSTVEDLYNWAQENFGSTELTDDLMNEYVRLSAAEDLAGLQALEEKMLQMIREKKGETGTSVTPLTDPLARGSIQSFDELLAARAYHDAALRQIGVDLGWTLALDGRESEAEEVRESFRVQLEQVLSERNASIKSGWRYKGERQVLAERERFWEAAEPELTRWVTEGIRERERRLRGGTGARLGRAISRLVGRE